jgi:hypothetical protein
MASRTITAKRATGSSVLPLKTVPFHTSSYEQRTLIERLLCERLSLRGSRRAVGVSLTWLLHFMVERFAACSRHLHVPIPSHPTAVVIRQLEAEADQA